MVRYWTGVFVGVQLQFDASLNSKDKLDTFQAVQNIVCYIASAPFTDWTRCENDIEILKERNFLYTFN